MEQIERCFEFTTEHNEVKLRDGKWSSKHLKTEFYKPMIKKALFLKPYQARTEEKTPRPNSSRHHLNASYIPAFVIALIPKCPFCFAAYLGVIVLTSLEVLHYYSLVPNTIALLLVSVTLMLIHKGRRQNDYRPIFFGLTGAAFILVGKLLFISQLIVAIGLILILIALIISSMPKRMAKVRSPILTFHVQFNIQTIFKLQEE